MAAALQLHATRVAQTARAQLQLSTLVKQLSGLRLDAGAAGGGGGGGGGGHMRTALTPGLALKIQHQSKAALSQLTASRHCIDNDDMDAGKFAVDPRFLIFEYLFDLLLRKRQVAMVCDFRNKAIMDESSCQQMIMGAGKTTVVGPLLTLCLADGDCLVMQVMPSNLLEMSRMVLRRIFTCLLPKGIFTLMFERGCDDDPAVARAVVAKLEDARRGRGVVVAPPECVKSLLLKFVELLHGLELSARLKGTIGAGGMDGMDGMGGMGGMGGDMDDDMPPPMALPSIARENSLSRREGIGLGLAGGLGAGGAMGMGMGMGMGGNMGGGLKSGGRRRRREEREEMQVAVKRSAMAQELAKVIRLWQGAVLIMDEVDMLLHPLRSELNFPIGDKTAIDLSGDRWELPMHLVELIFVRERPKNAGGGIRSSEWDKAEALLGYDRKSVVQDMLDALARGGPPRFALQESPHLVLLDTAFYRTDLAPVVAKWAMLWIFKVSFDDLQVAVSDTAKGSPSPSPSLSLPDLVAACGCRESSHDSQISHTYAHKSNRKGPDRKGRWGTRMTW